MKTIIKNIKSIDYKKMVMVIKETKNIKIVKERNQKDSFKYVNSNNTYNYLRLEELTLLYLNCLNLDNGEYKKFINEKIKKLNETDKIRREKNTKRMIETAHIRAGRLL